MSMPAASVPLKIAYTAQNCGIDLRTDVGEAIHVKYSLKSLKARGHRVDYVTLAERRVNLFLDVFQPEKATPLSQGITGTPAFNRVESAARYLQGRLHLPYLAAFDSLRFSSALRNSLPDYDLFHEHNGLLSIGTALACRKLKKPYVLTQAADLFVEMALDHQPLLGLRARAAAAAARFTYHTANRILCVSEPARRRLINTWGVDETRIVVLPNGVDIDCFHPDRDARSSRRNLGIGDEPVIMFVGSFMHWHGLDLLIDSFAEVVRSEPTARLVLVGDGPARSTVEQKINAWNLQGAAQITGLIPHQNIPDVLAAADIVVIPYPKLPEELWFSPLKMYEYMATGKAILASRAGQIAEVIKDGENGRLVEPGDPAALAQGLLSLLRDAPARASLGQNARRQAVAHHSWEQYAHRLEAIYQAVIGEAGQK